MHLPRRPQKAMVIAIGEHSAGAVPDAVHDPCKPRTDRFHAPPERQLIVGFHDQVRVISLKGVVHEAEAVAIAADGEGAVDGTNDAHVAEREHVVAHPQRHMRWHGLPKGRTRGVRHHRTSARLSPGPGPTPPPAPRRAEVECELGSSCGHLNKAMYVVCASSSQWDRTVRMPRRRSAVPSAAASVDSALLGSTDASMARRRAATRGLVGKSAARRDTRERRRGAARPVPASLQLQKPKARPRRLRRVSAGRLRRAFARGRPPPLALPPRQRRCS